MERFNVGSKQSAAGRSKEAVFQPSKQSVPRQTRYLVDTAVGVHPRASGIPTADKTRSTFVRNWRKSERGSDGKRRVFAESREERESMEERRWWQQKAETIKREP
eukprot:3650590-Rhodomonas_salina.1